MSRKEWIKVDTDRFLDNFLNREESEHKTQKEDFSSQWYDYMEEYGCNLY